MTQPASHSSGLPGNLLAKTTILLGQIKLRIVEDIVEERPKLPAVSAAFGELMKISRFKPRTSQTEERTNSSMIKRFLAAALAVTLLTPVVSNCVTSGSESQRTAGIAGFSDAMGANDLAGRIQRVENGLLPSTVIKGQSLPTMKLADRMKYHKIPGVSIAVINDYKIEWARGYGLREAGTDEAVTPDTLFQAGSVSKTLTAVTVLRLVQQGRLNLDEDVNHKLVSWKIPENEFTKNEKVTIRRLLTHTAGLTGSSSGEYPAGTAAPTLLQVLDGQKPATTPPIRVIEVPGSRQFYSSSSFFVLQQLLSDVTGKPFPQLVEELILRPLKMESSSFEQPLPRSFQMRAASGHYPGDKVVEGKWHIKPEMAAAGLWTTASDLARFVVEIQKSTAGRSNKILSKATTNRMLTSEQKRISGGEGVLVEERGLGFELKTAKNVVRFSHGGRTTGYNCQIIGFSNGQGLVVMTNGYNQGLVREIVRSVAQEYAWIEYLLRERTIVNVEAHLLEGYAGEYEFPEGRNPRISVVAVRDGKLYLDGMLLQAESKTRFFGVGEATYTFNRDEKGHVKEMVYDVGALQLTARKIK